MRVEFPDGSGRFADYDDEEMAMMHKIVHDAERPKHERIAEAEVLHDLKVEFGIHLVREVELGPPHPKLTIVIP